MAKEMTLDEALEILKGSIYSSRFAEAKKFVMDNDPHNPILFDVDLKEEKYEAENNLSKDDVAMYESNTAELNELEKGYTFDDLAERAGEAIAKFEIVDDAKDAQPLKAKEKKAYTELLFEAAKLKAKMNLTGDKEFHEMEIKEKAAAYKGLTDRIFFTDLVVGATGTALKDREDKNLDVHSKEYREYIEHQSEVAKVTIDGMFEEGKKAKVSTDQILASVADTAVKAETYIRQLRAKAKKVHETVGYATHAKLNEIAAGFKSRLNKLEDKADKISKGRYRAVYKTIRGNLHDNKVQLIGNTAATVALTAALATPAAPVALGVYGAYFVAGSWAYPIIERARRNNRARKERGEAELKFAASWKEAKKQLLAKTVEVEDERTGEIKVVENKDRKKYFSRAAVKTGVALVGFGLLANKIAKIEMARNIMETRKAVSLGRMGITNVAQATETVVAGVGVMKNKSADNKQDLKNAAIGFGIGLGASALTQVLNGNFELFGSKGDEVVDQIVQTNGGEELNVDEVLAAGDSIEVVEAADTTGMGAGVSGEELVDVAAQAEFEPFPKEWSEDLGISRREYNNLMSRLPGILKEVDENSPDRLYNNLNDEVMANFPGKTKMQVLYDAMEQFRNGRRSQYVLGNANFKFTDMYGEEQVGFYVNTPTGKVKITDEGVIAAAKQALANGDKISVARLHGEDFLVGQFHKMNIEGMDTEKMDAIVKIAMETYNPNEVKNAVVQIHEILPALDKAQLATITKIVDYNRRFDQNGKTMEALLHMMACGEQNGNGAEMNALLDRTQEILAQSHGNAVPMGQEVDCGKDHLVHVHRVVKEVKVEEPVVPVIEEPVIEEEPVVIPETRAPVLEDTIPPVKLAEYKAPEPVGREGIFESPQDMTGQAAVQRDVADETAGKKINILNQKAGRNR